MPGTNCAILGCNSSGRKKGIAAIFRVPTGNDEWSNSCRRNMINVATLDRLVDKTLKNRKYKKNIYVREKHFPEMQLLRCKCSSYFTTLLVVICSFVIRG